MSTVPCFCLTCNGRLVQVRTAQRHAERDAQPDPNLSADHSLADMSMSPLSGDFTSMSPSPSPSETSDDELSDFEDDEVDDFDEKMVDNSPQNPQEESKGSLHSQTVKHALWFIEHKFASKATGKQSTQAMHLTQACIKDVAGEDTNTSTIPNDFQQALVRTKHLVLDMIQMDTCVRDHYRFVDDRKECPLCDEPRFSSSGVARRAGFYVHPQHWFTRLLSIPRMYSQFSYMQEYVEDGKYCNDNDELRDFFSGSIFSDVVLEYVNKHGGDVFKTILCAICHDEVEITRWPKKNICPILLTIFNVAPWVRNLMTMLCMVGVMPTNCKNAQLYLEPVVKMFRELKPGIYIFNYIFNYMFNNMFNYMCNYTFNYMFNYLFIAIC